MRIAKVVPIERVINETRRRKDDYEWEGDYEKAKKEMDYIKELKELQEKGEVWYPNF
jgi:Zn-finger nucleic acid-binding protein